MRACRQLSYDGAEFELTKIALENIFQIQYGRAAALWQLLWMVLEKKGVFGSQLRATTMYAPAFEKVFKKCSFFSFCLPIAHRKILLRECCSQIQGSLSRRQKRGTDSVKKELSRGRFTPTSTLCF